MQFNDRTLKCSDCATDFVFTAGEQLFFADRDFKNDPKRCKLCKAKRSGSQKLSAGGAALPLSRTETRTECSACGIETTVPFKPTQGRPVLCRSCFQMKRVPSAVSAVATMDSVSAQVEAAAAALQGGGQLPAAMAAAAGTHAMAEDAPSASATMNIIAAAPVEAHVEPPSAEMMAAAAAAPEA